MRLVRRVFVVGALASLAVGFVPSASAQTPTVISVIGSADGLSASLDVTVIEVSESLAVGPTPTVTLPATGGTVSDEALGFSEDVASAVSLSAATLAASTQGELGPAGNASAEAVAEELSLAIVGAAGLIEAEAISASCAADLGGVTGTTTLVGASVLGEALAVDPAPNTVVPISVPTLGDATVTLNQQIQNADGSLSVTALLVEIDISVAFGQGLLAIEASLAFGPATCGVVEGEIPPPVPAPIEVTPRFTG
jgi:hypothetical protein